MCHSPDTTEKEIRATEILIGTKKLLSSSIESRELGYSGKEVIHPSQIAIANEIFSPSEEEISRAVEIVSAMRKLYFRELERSGSTTNLWAMYTIGKQRKS